MSNPQNHAVKDALPYTVLSDAAASPGQLTAQTRVSVPRQSLSSQNHLESQNPPRFSPPICKVERGFSPRFKRSPSAQGRTEGSSPRTSCTGRKAQLYVCVYLLPSEQQLSMWIQLLRSSYSETGGAPCAEKPLANIKDRYGRSRKALAMPRTRLARRSAALGLS